MPQKTAHWVSFSRKSPGQTPSVSTIRGFRAQFLADPPSSAVPSGLLSPRVPAGMLSNRRPTTRPPALRVYASAV
ncbi:hypothetical protein HMPREF1868_00302 [Olsenella sp. DNF00959]|nr:hypothetical protein HMPREF1868_00302 [Olsenella sp. DNF00959]